MAMNQHMVINPGAKLPLLVLLTGSLTIVPDNG